MIGPHNTAVELKDGTVQVAPIINAKPYRGQEDISERPAKAPKVITVETSSDSNIRAYLGSEDESPPRPSTS